MAARAVSILRSVGRSDRIEIELPADYGLGRSGRISVLPRRYRHLPGAYPNRVQLIR